MLEVAENFMGFRPSDKLESICADAYEFVDKAEEAQMIIMDVNYQEEDTSISPPWKFLEADFIKKLLSLSQEHTFLAINALCYTEDAKKRIVETLK